ncbi:MAG: PAS domain-containing sensor histidine kinase [Proteobacteria bacterium]|nr:PAS domain-containing sensor histidine kinase [Pseudomonadota bacterium]
MIRHWGRRLPLSLQFGAIALLYVTAAAALAAFLSQWMAEPWLVVLIAAAVLAPLLVYHVQRAFAPMNSLFRALAGSVASYRDGDYSFGLSWQGGDELAELVASHNRLGEALREQRLALVQRELLLETMVQNTPVAMILIDPGRHVVHANLAARKLLGEGRRLEGHTFENLLAGAHDALRDAFERGGDGMFTVGDEDEEDIYHLSRRQFRLNGRRHELVLLRVLTAELRRQEVQTWKKVIRVISHELNNSLAPIASLAHSGSELLRRGQYDKLPTALATIEDRARHLEGFIRDYARFAKLPAPRRTPIEWSRFVAQLRTQVEFTFDGKCSDGIARVDVAQLEQSLINLLKNAHESGSPPHEVALALRRTPGAWRIDVLDRGTGIPEHIVEQLFRPFFTTSGHGTGLGLYIARELCRANQASLDYVPLPGGGACFRIRLTGTMTRKS